MHFSEIILLQFGKERHKLLCILKLFTNIFDQFSFWISITLVGICFYRIFNKPRKNTFELVARSLITRDVVSDDSLTVYSLPFLSTF